MKHCLAVEYSFWTVKMVQLSHLQNHAYYAGIMLDAFAHVQVYFVWFSQARGHIYFT